MNSSYTFDDAALGAGSPPVAHSALNASQFPSADIAQDTGNAFTNNYSPQFAQSLAMQQQSQMSQHPSDVLSQYGVSNDFAFGQIYGNSYHAPTNGTPYPAANPPAQYSNDNIGNIYSPSTNYINPDFATQQANAARAYQTLPAANGLFPSPPESRSPASNKTSSSTSPTEQIAQTVQAMQMATGIQQQMPTSVAMQSLLTGQTLTEAPSALMGHPGISPSRSHTPSVHSPAVHPLVSTHHGASHQGQMAASRAMRTQTSSSPSSATPNDQTKLTDSNLKQFMPPQKYAALVHQAQQRGVTPPHYIALLRQTQQDNIARGNTPLPQNTPQPGATQAGTKRRASNTAEDASTPAKRLATDNNNVLHQKAPQAQPQLRKLSGVQAQLRAQQLHHQAQMRAQQQATQLQAQQQATEVHAQQQGTLHSSQQANTDASAQEQQKLKEAWSRAELAKMARQQEMNQQQKAEFEKQQQEKARLAQEQQKALVEQQQRDAADAQQKALREQHMAAERRRVANEEAERLVEVEKQRIEKKSRAVRKEELRKDESALFRYYDEFIDHFRLGRGERRSQFHNKLLANRPKPLDSEGDLALAIRYAKDHWYNYFEFPRDSKYCTSKERERMAKIEATTKGTRGTAAKK